MPVSRLSLGGAANHMGWTLAANTHRVEFGQRGHNAIRRLSKQWSNRWGDESRWTSADT